jgi:hypothetical protein
VTVREAAARALGLARRCLRVCGALWRFAQARTPRWLWPVLAVCLAIPGPVDEVVVLGMVLAVVLVPVLVSAEARRELGGMVRTAWRS